MQLSYKYVLKDQTAKYKLLDLRKISKALYNQALYLVKQNLNEDKGFLFYLDLNKQMQNTVNTNGQINYRLLKAQVSQQCLRQLDKNLRTYISTINDFKKRPEKYHGKPQIPTYKDSYNQLIYPNQSCKITNDGLLRLNKTLVTKIPQFEVYKKDLLNFQQVRVNPKYKGEQIEIEIVYNVPDVVCDTKKENIASIDLGLDNLVTLVTNTGQPLIFNGKPIKSYNKYFNKTLTCVKSELEKVNKYKSSKRIRTPYLKRESYPNDIYHKISKYIVDYLSDSGVGTLVVGLNKGWKDSINIGKSNNQAFTNISHGRLIDLLSYKCSLHGIEVIINEESYTSKCDGLCLEEICKHDAYSGKRVKRGLFHSGCGEYINADVNGALNIMRKVFGDSVAVQEIIDSGWLFHPLKLNNATTLHYSGL